MNPRKARWKGKLQQVGTPLELYECPANLFVASFIGTPPMNFLPATLAEGGTTLAGPRFRLPVPSAQRAATSGRDGRRVTVGVRPENILDGTCTARGETARIAVEVEIVEPLGHEVIVHGRIGDDLIVTTVDPHRAPQIGQPFEIDLELDALHLFDSETERRLTA